MNVKVHFHTLYTYGFKFIAAECVEESLNGLRRP